MFWFLTLGLAVAAPQPETYLGHQVVWGTVSVPLRGDVDIRTDTHMVVRMETLEDGSVHWRQRDCKITMTPMMGIKSYFAEGAVPLLPQTSARLISLSPGALKGRWQTTWTQTDHDQDGYPGVSVHVDMPVCGGAVYITMTNHTQAVATRVGREWVGEVNLSLERRMLGASNWCLRLGPNRENQTMTGIFLLQPAADADVDCDTADNAAWPNAIRDG